MIVTLDLFFYYFSNGTCHVCRAGYGRDRGGERGVEFLEFSFDDLGCNEHVEVNAVGNVLRSIWDRAEDFGLGTWVGREEN